MWTAKAVPALLGLLICVPAWGQSEVSENEEPSSWVWYVIRPGDTIEGLTIRYLGSRDRWRENADLNTEEFPNPNVIQPGARIKLLAPTQLPADGALVTDISNHVEGQPTPLDWTDAQPQDLLRARDGVKTGEQSSAGLEFADKTRLVVTEESIVFIGDEETAPEAVDRTQIEIVVGQADLESSSDVTADSSQFEIVLGDATATPTASEDDALQTRARRVESGGAQLMVYRGESELASAGTTVKVATGMGSSVPEGEAPKPPEKLLPAPADLDPAAGAGLATPRPEFNWAPVADARDYTLEVCRDPHCGALVERIVELSEPSWQPAGLPVEKLYWRVTAVSTSGLDGYPSEAVPFEILSAVADTEAPTVQISFTGPQLAPRSGLNDRWIVGPGMTIEVEVEDAGSGVGEWAPSIDGEDVELTALEGPWNRGEHTLTVVATDRAGNRREVEVPFTYDPDPPELSWGVEGGGELGRIGGDPSGGIAGLGRAWRGRREMKVGKRWWQLDSDLAEVLVRPLTGKSIGIKGLGKIGRDYGLWVLAQDAVCTDLDDLAYELVPGSAKDEYWLRFEATDCIGNQRRGELALTRQK